MQASPHNGLEDDLRSRMATIMAERRPFALVTTFAADGGPRGVGAQMVVTETDSFGFVSGGCIEGDVAIQARGVLADGAARHLVYGRGSPWVDLPLPCGGRLDLLAERIEPGDAAIEAFVAAYADRRQARYRSNGEMRSCTSPSDDASSEWTVDHIFSPPQRLIVVGSDPIALAMATLAGSLGWPAQLIGPAEVQSLADLQLDAWTAIAVATHDLHADEDAIAAALETEAGYIGVLGARRRIPDRVASLRGRGVSQAAIDRLKMPIGLPIRAATPWEIAVSTVAEIIAERHAAR